MCVFIIAYDCLVLQEAYDRLVLQDCSTKHVTAFFALGKGGASGLALV